jgi:hypothetical protein
MKWTSLLILFMLCIASGSGPSQELLANGLPNPQIGPLASSGTNIPSEAPPEFIGVSSRMRSQTAMQSGDGTLHLDGSSYPFSNDRFMPGRVQVKSGYVRAKSFPQSLVYIIDTAIVLSSGPMRDDTTRYLNLYDAHGKRTSELIQKLRGNLWVDDSRVTNTYDADGKNVSELWEWWSNGQWVNSSHVTYTYDVSGNRLSAIYERWSDAQWVNGWRFTYTYDANGQLLCELVGGQRITYTYDTSGNILTRLYERSNGQWVISGRYTCTYDSNGNRLTQLYEVWLNSQWVNESQYTYSHDANGHVISELIETWSNGQWVNSWRGIFTFDSNGNMLLWWHYNWDGSAWTPERIPEGRYLGPPLPPNITDAAGNSFYFQGYNANFAWKAISFTGFAMEDGNTAASYSLSQNYPNPFNPTTTVGYTVGVVSGQQTAVSWVRLAVYDLLGREVAVLVNEKREPGCYTVTWDASGMASGVYLCRLQAGSFMQTRQLLLLR